MNISDSLLSAYQTTDYRIYAAKPYIMRIGIRFPEAIESLAKCAPDRGGLWITAWKLGSKITTNCENNRRLEIELKEHGLQVSHSEGLARNSPYMERGFFAMTATRDQARWLCDKWQQDAVVFVGQSGIPELLLNSELKLP